MNELTFPSREQCMEAALTDALNWLETGGGDVVSGELFFLRNVNSKVIHDVVRGELFD